MEKPNPVQPQRQDFQNSEPDSDKVISQPVPDKPARAHNPGRFDNDPERAREAGRKGGENPNNAGRFDNNPARARAAGQKGGQSSQAARHATTT